LARSPQPTALLGLPSGHACAALRGALMAMNVVPDVLPSKNGTLIAALLASADAPRSVAFVDITDAPRLLDLDHALPRTPLRSRIFFTRLGNHAHTSVADRQWVQDLGFGGLWAEFDLDDAEGELRDALVAVAAVLGLPAPSSVAALTRHMRLDEPRNAPARATIRRIAGAPAEVVAAVSSRRLSIRNRRYHLREYPACFVGSAAVRTLAKAYGCARDEALELGNALHALGLLVHVAHDHDLIDGEYFYRLAVSSKADAVSLGRARLALREGLPGGEAEPAWTGALIVDVLVQAFDLERHHAWIVAQRLAQFGVIASVPRGKPFMDDLKPYTFTSPQDLRHAAARAPASRQTPAAALPAW
jgi:hypothetical protein